jgi:hypothetical protein
MTGWPARIVTVGGGATAVFRQMLRHFRIG